MSANLPSETRKVLESIIAKQGVTGVKPLEVPAMIIDAPVLGPPIQGGPQAMPKPLPKAPPLLPPKNAYLSKVFKEGIRPEMFNAPPELENDLPALCTRFNFVAKQAGDLRDVVLAKLGLNTGQTGHYPVGKLAEDTNRFWNALHEERFKAEQREKAKNGETVDPDAKPDPVPDIPSLKSIEESAIGWKAGSGVDSIKQHRATDIGTVKLDVDRPKQAIVKVEALTDANDQLEKAGSFIRLEMAGPPDKDGFVKIRPVFRTDRKLTATHDESHEKLMALNGPRQGKVASGSEVPEEGQYVSWADCHRTAQTIMGSEDNASGIGDTEHVAMTVETEGGEKESLLVAPVPKNRIKEIPLASDHGANRAMHGFFAQAMPKLKKRIEAKVKNGGEPTDTETEALRLIEEQLKDKSDTPKNYRAVYAKLCTDPAIAKEFAEAFGVNEAIKPKVGTAFAQINDEAEKANAPEGVDQWNFHFAGVVLVNKDGSYMTLENLSVEDTTAVNDNWYFALYDPKTGKSFHEVNKQDSHVGKSPITLLFDKAPTK